MNTKDGEDTESERGRDGETQRGEQNVGECELKPQSATKLLAAVHLGFVNKKKEEEEEEEEEEGAVPIDPVWAEGDEGAGK